MLTEQQLKCRVWLEETQVELKDIKRSVNGNTNAAISLLINKVTDKYKYKYKYKH